MNSSIRNDFFLTGLNKKNIQKPQIVTYNLEKKINKKQAGEKGSIHNILKQFETNLSNGASEVKTLNTNTMQYIHQERSQKVNNKNNNLLLKKNKNTKVLNLHPTISNINNNNSIEKVTNNKGNNVNEKVTNNKGNNVNEKVTNNKGNNGNEKVTNNNANNDNERVTNNNVNNDNERVTNNNVNNDNERVTNNNINNGKERLTNKKPNNRNEKVINKKPNSNKIVTNKKPNNSNKKLTNKKLNNTVINRREISIHQSNNLQRNTSKTIFNKNKMLPSKFDKDKKIDSLYNRLLTDNLLDVKKTNKGSKSMLKLDNNINDLDNLANLSYKKLINKLANDSNKQLINEINNYDKKSVTKLKKLVKKLIEYINNIYELEELTENEKKIYIKKIKSNLERNKLINKELNNI